MKICGDQLPERARGFAVNNASSQFHNVPARWTPPSGARSSALISDGKFQALLALSESGCRHSHRWTNDVRIMGCRGAYGVGFIS
jgi:hypothetical protein